MGKNLLLTRSGHSALGSWEDPTPVRYRGTWKGGRLNGIIRAALGGVLLDLCSHGILMGGAKLYERGRGRGYVKRILPPYG